MKIGNVYTTSGLRTIQAAGCKGTWTMLGRKTDQNRPGGTGATLVN